MNKYYGSWSANNGSTYGTDYTDTNFCKLRKLLRLILDGNVFYRNSGWWAIYADKDHKEEIASGTIQH